METRALKALQASIAYWKDIVDDKAVCTGSEGCALCKEFRDNFPASLPCQGCPIYEITNKLYCRETPYNIYATEPTKENAERMLAFLESLLPSEL